MIKNIITRMKLWLMPNKLKNCKKCCLTCRYFDRYCKDEFFD